MMYALIACVVSAVVSFFFFKQKTAYEMRISDWSSDVCSSDLPDAGAGRGRTVAEDGADPPGAGGGARVPDARRSAGRAGAGHRHRHRHDALNRPDPWSVKKPGATFAPCWPLCSVIALLNCRTVRYVGHLSSLMPWATDDTHSHSKAITGQPATKH